MIDLEHMKEMADKIRTYRALTITEPWASMIARGEKLIEVRSSNLSYRGDFLVHVSKVPRTKWSGHAIVLVNLMDVRPMTVEDEKLSFCKFEADKWAYVLTSIRRIKPIEIRGSQGLWRYRTTVDNDLVFI
jgi:hypothetical protein